MPDGDFDGTGADRRDRARPSGSRHDLGERASRRSRRGLTSSSRVVGEPSPVAVQDRNAAGGRRLTPLTTSRAIRSQAGGRQREWAERVNVGGHHQTQGSRPT